MGSQRRLGRGSALIAGFMIWALRLLCPLLQMLHGALSPGLLLLVVFAQGGAGLVAMCLLRSQPEQQTEAPSKDSRGSHGVQGTDVNEDMDAGATEDTDIDSQHQKTSGPED